MTATGPMRATGDTMQLRVPEIVSGSGSSFKAGMRLLPAPRRRAILAIYAFCRLVDDMVDGPAPLAEKRAYLDAWATELARVRAGCPDTPVGREIARASRAYGLPHEEFELVLDGMRMDLDGVIAPDEARLDAYIRRVAGAVGILSMHVFGAWRGEASRRFALSLAEALQLTNILRDVEEDADLGRLYLPAGLLAETGIPAHPAAVPGAPGLPQARRRLAARARAAFADAAREIGAHSRLRIAPALLMMGPYERLLREIEANPSRPPRPRPRWRKLLDGLACLAGGGAAR
ncbi:squalene/phytoene synthase family protein [Limimaricola hongkongensis]|uniref:Phytoene synthase n=1 Tax=Limimaricola hongkongensis DSM 17492 TaxID=1122180 RepID=A0A017H7U8_9RHOB|nr:squalene/phytoene synthase family protein [Limimaricola hongkongensis]EYD70451.1 Phytoene synthase [Limimaricola hongkongensis DSM 17492]